MKNQISTLALLSLALTACGQETNPLLAGGSTAPSAPVLKNSVDSNGNCTQAFILNYQQAARTIKSFNAKSETPVADQLQAIQDSCDLFFSHHLANVSCVANVENGTKTLKGSVIQKKCDRAKAAINGSISITEFLKPKGCPLSREAL